MTNQSKRLVKQCQLLKWYTCNWILSNHSNNDDVSVFKSDGLGGLRSISGSNWFKCASSFEYLYCTCPVSSNPLGHLLFKRSLQRLLQCVLNMGICTTSKRMTSMHSYKSTLINIWLFPYGHLHSLFIPIFKVSDKAIKPTRVNEINMKWFPPRLACFKVDELLAQLLKLYSVHHWLWINIALWYCLTNAANAFDILSIQRHNCSICS